MGSFYDAFHEKGSKTVGVGVGCGGWGGFGGVGCGVSKNPNWDRTGV